MYQAQFEIDGFEGVFTGYTDGDHWNGFACPYFTKEVAIQVAAAYSENEYIESSGYKGWYDESKDAFCFTSDNYPDASDCEEFPAVEHKVNGEVVKLYSIGAGCWIWNEAEVA